MEATVQSHSSSNSGGLPLLLASLSALWPWSSDAYRPSMGEIQRVMSASPYALQMTLTAEGTALNHVVKETVAL